MTRLRSGVESGGRAGTVARAGVLGAVLVALLALPLPPAAAGEPAEMTREELICMALAQNDVLFAADAELAAARAAYEEASAAYWYPHVAFEGAFGGPVQQARGNAIDVTPESRRDGFTFDGAGILIRGELEVVYPVYTFGRLSAARNATRHLVAAAEAGRLVRERRIALQVDATVDAMLFAGEMERVLARGEDQVESALAFIEEELEADSLEYSAVDRDRLLLARTELRQRRRQVRQLGESSMAALAALTNWKRPEPPRIAPEPFEPPEPPEAPAPEPTELALRQPELSVARAAEAAKAELATEARRAFFPSIVIIGGYRAAYSNAADDQLSPFAYDPYNYHEGGLALGTRVDLDIGLLLARSRRAAADAAQAAFESRAASRGLGAQIETAAVSLRRARERAQILREGLEAAERWVVAESLDFTAGVGDTSDLVDALVFFYQGRFSQLEAIFEARKAAAEYAHYLRAERPPEPICLASVRARVTAPVVAAQARAGAGTPREVLRANIDSVQHAIERGREAEARERALRLIDFEELSRRTLVRQWPTLTAQQRRRFVEAFSEVIATNYVNRLKQVRHLSVEIVAEEPAGEDVWLSTRAQAEGTEVETDYLFSGGRGQWHVVDIRVEGVSLTARYARSFSRVIQQHGFDELVRRLRSRARSLTR